jgi:hypothetical protein
MITTGDDTVSAEGGIFQVTAKVFGALSIIST